VKPESFVHLLKPLVILLKRKPKEPDNAVQEVEETAANESDEEIIPEPAKDEEDVEFIVRNLNEENEQDDGAPEDEPVSPENITSVKGPIIHDLDNDTPENKQPDTVPINISRPEADDLLTDKEVERIMENYDPRLDLSKYKFPPVSILKEHKSETSFDNTEVFENKENIIKTLGDHKISIRSISATIGPTVTLYEIVPERGVKIARIKSLEDDIALNLSALGIRIIAPIPGRGTVGIEVPNKKPEMVSMRSLITSKAFQETKFDIALALGRTITNEPFIVDLTKMPHLLVAGATGQGKSVGINAIITSIL
jgi:S-DNA-T family DNA segregation ATPase FtsK/SpoIIIE